MPEQIGAASLIKTGTTTYLTTGDSALYYDNTYDAGELGYDSDEEAIRLTIGTGVYKLFKTTLPGGSDTYIQFNDGGTSFNGTSDLVFLKTSKYLGIGESSPSTNLHVKASDTGLSPIGSDNIAVFEENDDSYLEILTGTTNTSGLLLSDGSAYGGISYNHSSNTLELKSNSNSYIYINSAGKVGVNESTPLTSLQVTMSEVYSHSNVAGVLINPTSNAGDGNFGGALILGRADGLPADKSGVAIIAYQDGSDVDNIGIKFAVHGSTSSDPRFEVLTIEPDGDIRHSVSTNTRLQHAITNSSTGNSARSELRLESSSGSTTFAMYGGSHSSLPNLARVFSDGNIDGIAIDVNGSDSVLGTGIFVDDVNNNIQIGDIKGSDYAKFESDGDLRFSASGDTREITMDTSDGSDNKYLGLGGGGSASRTRGASIFLFGNEYTGNEGELLLDGGADSASGKVRIRADGNERIVVDYTGNTYIGDGGTTNYMQIEPAGDLNFVGGAGFQYGGISVKQNTSTQTATVQNTWYKVDDFDTPENVNGDVTVSTSIDRITFGKAGEYYISCFIDCEKTGGEGTSNSWEFEVKINGTTSIDNLFGEMEPNDYWFHGTLCGSESFSASDYIELYFRCTDDAGDTVTFKSVSLFAMQIGG